MGVARTYGFTKVTTPLVDGRDTFTALGDSSDVTSKETFTLGDNLVLRPEATAQIARAFGSNGRRRVCYAGPMFRAERPQANRFRQFTQFGVEDLNTTSTASTLEVIDLALRCVAAVRSDATLVAGSVGCVECRPTLERELRARAAATPVCDDCTRRAALSPLRMLDCKDPACPAPGFASSFEFLCTGCTAELEAVCDAFDTAPDPRLVRGLEYYSGVVFEIVDTAQLALCGGGGYRDVGPADAGVGFAIGVERLLAATVPQEPSRQGLGVVAAGDPLPVVGFAAELRRRGGVVVCEAQGRNVRAGLRQLERTRCRFSVVIGADELAGSASLLVRDLDSGDELNVELDDLMRFTR